MVGKSALVVPLDVARRYVADGRRPPGAVDPGGRAGRRPETSIGGSANSDCAGHQRNCGAVGLLVFMTSPVCV